MFVKFSLKWFSLKCFKWCFLVIFKKDWFVHECQISKRWDFQRRCKNEVSGQCTAGISFGWMSSSNATIFQSDFWCEKACIVSPLQRAANLEESLHFAPPTQSCCVATQHLFNSWIVWLVQTVSETNWQIGFLHLFTIQCCLFDKSSAWTLLVCSHFHFIASAGVLLGHLVGQTFWWCAFPVFQDVECLSSGAILPLASNTFAHSSKSIPASWGCLVLSHCTQWRHPSHDWLDLTFLLEAQVSQWDATGNASWIFMDDPTLIFVSEVTQRLFTIDKGFLWVMKWHWFSELRCTLMRITNLSLVQSISWSVNFHELFSTPVSNSIVHHVRGLRSTYSE